MRSTVPGSARTLLLAALAIAAAAMVAAIAYMASRGGSNDAPQKADERTKQSHLGGGDPLRRTPTETDDGEDGEDDDPEGDIFIGADGKVRDVPDDAPEFWVTPESLRAVLGGKPPHWEEVRRMIDVIQEGGKPVPEDVVKDLVAMLAKDDTRLDAVLALGGVKDEATGKILAELAVSNDADVETRQAALDTLAKSGQRSTLPLLQQLIASEGLDEGVARHAYGALAGVGGPDATKTLIDELRRHAGDDLENAISVALGKARDADSGLAQVIRSARDGGQRDLLDAALTAALFQGTAAVAGPELKAELLQMIEGTSALSEFTTDEDRLRMQGHAMPAAAASGLIEPLLRVATTSGIMRDSALNALRHARGDEAARLIAASLQRSSDETVRRELTVALGETGSRAATSTLCALLSDENGNIRHAAARGLGQIRDPASVKPILAALSKAAPDYEFANGLVQALGIIGAHEALAPLQKLVASEEAFWLSLRVFIQNAIVRIKTGNPKSAALSTSGDEQAQK